MSRKLTEQEFFQAISLLGLKSSSGRMITNGFYYCPFKEEKTPSLSISLDKNSYHCFGCKRHGTLNNLSYELTKKTIYSLVGKKENAFVDFGKEDEGIQYQKKEVDESKIVVDIRGVLYPYTHSKEAIDYLEKRGISKEVADFLHIQYTEGCYVNGFYFKNRIMTPILGKTGRMVNIEGRDISGEAKKKVLYPKSTIKPIFNFLSLDTTKPLYIVEGMMDLAFMLSDSFFKNSTTMFGSSTSSYQNDMLNLFPEVIIIPNNDEAGELSIINLRKAITSPVNVLRIQNKKYKDVNELWQKDKITCKNYRESGGFVLQNEGFSL